MRTLNLDPYARFDVLRDAGWEREYLIDWYRLSGVDIYTTPVLEWTTASVSAVKAHRRAWPEAWIPEDEEEAVALLNRQAFAGLLPADQPLERPAASKRGICWVDRIGASPLLRSEILPELPSRFIGSPHLVGPRPKLIARLAGQEYGAAAVVLHPSWISSIAKRLNCAFRVELQDATFDDVDLYLDNRPGPLQLFHARKPC